MKNLNKIVCFIIPGVGGTNGGPGEDGDYLGLGGEGSGGDISEIPLKIFTLTPSEGGIPYKRCESINAIIKVSRYLIGAL